MAEAALDSTTDSCGSGGIISRGGGGGGISVGGGGGGGGGGGCSANTCEMIVWGGGGGGVGRTVSGGTSVNTVGRSGIGVDPDGAIGGPESIENWRSPAIPDKQQTKLLKIESYDYLLM